MLLSTADAIRQRSLVITKLYRGTTQIWTPSGGGGGSFATPALVKQTQGQNATSTSWTMSVTSTAGNALVAMFNSSAGGTGSVTSLTDTGGNTWTEVVDLGTSGQANTGISMWYCLNAASPVTITAATSSHSWQWQVVEFSDVATSSQPDHAPAGTTNSSATTSLVSTQATTTQANSLVIGMVGYGAAATSTLTSADGMILLIPRLPDQSILGQHI